ncbi:DMT family transporter [Salinimonas lutimaris]|uniref:DMT family transporter n=1 Tax=Salinimonas lutimaris TaxID=914153 RepID=UPI0010C0F312|nr:DMT family transporter [Salinimonas lutimaris]
MRITSRFAKEPILTNLKNNSLILVAMLAFAANSMLCRMAMSVADMEPGDFTVVRLLSGTLMLILLGSVKQKSWRNKEGSWLGAFCLFIYAAAFSFAYQGMTTGTGALLLFGAVQITMLLVSYFRGERFNKPQLLGFNLAVGGLLILLLPGASSPDPLSAALMVSAGVAWGAYTLLGKGTSKPLQLSAGNFLRSLIFVLPLFFILDTGLSIDFADSGFVYAVLSGAIASGAGYAIWYSVLPSLSGPQAATIQLSVPVLAMVMGWLALSEAITMQMVAAGGITMGGIFLVIRAR